MTTLQTINASASPEVQINENTIALSPAGLFARKSTTTAGLTWGYYGGIFPGSYAVIADGTKTLTDAATNYIECDSAGVVYTNTSAFTAGRNRLYTVVCAGGVQTGYTDYRSAIGVNVPGLAAANTWTALNTFNAGISIPTGQSVTGAGTATVTGFQSGVFGTAGNTGTVKLLGTTSGTATFSVDATTTTVTLDKALSIGANALTAGAISGTTGTFNATGISGVFGNATGGSNGITINSEAAGNPYFALMQNSVNKAVLQYTDSDSSLTTSVGSGVTKLSTTGLAVTGTLSTSSTIKTAATSLGGTGAWKLGIRGTGTFALSTTQAIKVEIDGVEYNLGVVT